MNSGISDVSQEDYVKVTVSLPVDTVAKLDSMAKNSLLMSRGRVIQSLVDEAIEVQKTVQGLQTNLQAIKPENFNNQQSLSGVFFLIIFAIADISKRLSKFGKT